MRKIIAIIIAVVLAFIIAMGDQIVKMGLSDNPFSITKIKSLFSFSSDANKINPQIPKITEKPKIEENLTYGERITKGDYYYNKGFLVYAASEYTKAANLEPKKTDPYFKLMQTNFDLMYYEKANNNASQILTLDASNAKAKYFQVLISIKQSKLIEAEKLIDQLIANGSADYRLQYLKGILQITFGKHDEGKKTITQLSKNTSIDSTTSDGITKILKSYQEFEFAKSAESLYLSELLARSLNQIGEYEMAIYKLKNILTSRSDLRDSWILLGFSYLNLQKYVFASTAFQRAYALDSSWPATQYFLGITYAELKQYNDAIIYLNYALSNGFTPNLVIKQKLADLYLQVKDYKKSVAAYEEVLKSNQQSIDSFVRPVWIYLDFLNEPAKAVKLGESALISFPNSAMAYNLLGWSQVGTKSYTEAEKNLKKAIEMDSKLPSAHYNLAKLYEVIEKKELAMESYKNAYNLDQNGSIGNLAAKRYNTLFTQ